MFGPKISNVFKSRWQALFWAASVLLTAYCSVPSAEQTDNSAAGSAATPGHVNPWSKTLASD